MIVLPLILLFSVGLVCVGFLVSGLHSQLRFENYVQSMNQNMVNESNRIKKQNIENPYLRAAEWDVEEMVQKWNEKVI